MKEVDVVGFGYQSEKDKEMVCKEKQDYLYIEFLSSSSFLISYHFLWARLLL